MPAFTWNPSDKGSGITLSGGDLIATGTAGGTTYGVRANAPPKLETLGAIYQVEFTLGAVPSAVNSIMLGFANAAASMSAASFPGVADNLGVGVAIQSGSWQVNDNSATDSSGSATFTTGDKITIGIGRNNFYFYHNGTRKATVAISAIGKGGGLYPYLGAQEDFSATANFGASAFTYLIPGATAWQETGGTDLTGYGGGSTGRGVDIGGLWPPAIKNPGLRSINQRNRYDNLRPALVDWWIGSPAPPATASAYSFGVIIG